MVMKFRHLFSLALVGLALGGCTNDDIVATEGDGGAGVTGGTPDAGFVTLSINLPTTKVIDRAWADENDGSLEDGTANEYDVNNAILVVLSKAADAVDDAAKVLKAYKLGDMEPWKNENDDPNQVTTHANMVAEVPAKVENENRYALVILNGYNLFDVNEAGEIRLIGGTGNALGTFADLNEAMVKASVKTVAEVNAGGFLMANAPLYKENMVDIKTLVNIDANVYPTKEQAANSEGTSIYVERATAKVEISSNNVAMPENGIYSQDEVEISEWTLDLTNKYSYLMRKVDAAKWNQSGWHMGFWGSRTVDKNTMGRIYWAVDPNYDLEKAQGVYSVFDKEENVKFHFNVADDKTKFGPASEPQYCLENTFDINNMNTNQTTRVVFKGVYTPAGFEKGEDFFKIGTDNGLYHKMYRIEGDDDVTAAEALADIKGKADGSAITGLGNSVYALVLGKLVALHTQQPELGLNIINVDQIAEFDLPAGFAAEKGIQSLDGLKIKYSTYVDKNKPNKVYSAKDYTGMTQEQKNNVNVTLDITTLSDEVIAALSASVGKIDCFKNGISYYDTRIRHFDDGFTPWTADEAEAGANYVDAKHTGRWGVVRNNWYKLNVRSVSGPGSSTIPGWGNNPDDKPQYYIKVDVNVMSWAVRTQDVDL